MTNETAKQVGTPMKMDKWLMRNNTTKRIKNGYRKKNFDIFERSFRRMLRFRGRDFGLPSEP